MPHGHTSPIAAGHRNRPTLGTRQGERLLPETRWAGSKPCVHGTVAQELLLDGLQVPTLKTVLVVTQFRKIRGYARRAMTPGTFVIEEDAVPACAPSSKLASLHGWLPRRFRADLAKGSICTLTWCFLVGATGFEPVTPRL
jgi:hypothetical protein